MPIIDLAVVAWRKSSYSSGNNNCVEIASGTVWRKASYSQGDSNCVEVASGTVWQKATYSQGNNNCVEVASGEPAWAALRDSKNPDAGAVVVPADRFGRMVDALAAQR